MASIKAGPGQQGYTTAEYAVGTVAATGFACTLWVLSPWFYQLLLAIFDLVFRLVVDAAVRHMPLLFLRW
jgi:Protein of unknown function (DUF4244)